MSIEDSNGSQGQPTSNPSDMQNKIDQDLNTATHQARSDLDAVGEQVKADAQKLGHEARQKVSDATDTAKSFASGQKDLAAEQINGVASAIGKVAEELDGNDQQYVARYARDIASGLSSMGKTIETRDVDELMGMAQDFGRKQPVAFLGAAALAGFIASRFALASTHRREQKAAALSSNYQSEGGSYATGAPTGQRTGGQ